MKNIKKILLVVLVLFMTGCLSEKEKIELITKELGSRYSNFEIIDNCSYSNEGGMDELYSIVKVNGEYEFVYSNYRNNKLDMYEETFMGTLNVVDDNYIEASATNNGEYARVDYFLIFDTSKFNRDEIKKIIEGKALNYYMADMKTSEVAVYLKIMFASSLSEDMDAYKKVMLSNVKVTCSSKFYNKYKDNTNLIGDSSSGFTISIHKETNTITYDEIKNDIDYFFSKIDDNYIFVR